MNGLPQSIKIKTKLAAINKQLVLHTKMMTLNTAMVEKYKLSLVFAAAIPYRNMG